MVSGSPLCARGLTWITYRFELYERNHGRGKSDKEYSIRLSLSEGAHSSNVLDSALDARHSLNVQPRRFVSLHCTIEILRSRVCSFRRKLTQHLPYSLVIEKLSKHFGRIMEVDLCPICPGRAATDGCVQDDSTDLETPAETMYETIEPLAHQPSGHMSDSTMDD